MARKDVKIDASLIEKFSEEEVLVLCGGTAKRPIKSVNFGCPETPDSINFWCTPTNYSCR